MKKTITLASIALILILNSVSAQSKKEIRNYKIKSVTETVTLYTNGQAGTPYKSSYTAYAKDGRVTEEAHYNKDGSVKKKETTTYDKNGNKIEEVKYEAASSEPNEVTNKKTAYKYDKDNNKVEEVEYDVNGKVIKKSTFLYSPMGERTTEFELDGATNTVRKHTYSYNNKGLRTETKIFNDKNVIEYSKTYTYEY